MAMAGRGGSPARQAGFGCAGSRVDRCAGLTLRGFRPLSRYGYERVPPANPAGVAAAPLRRTGKGPFLRGVRPAMPVFSCAGSRVDRCAGLILSGFRPAMPVFTEP